MQSNFCWVIQLFSLVCTVKGYYDRESLTLGGSGGCPTRARGTGGADLGCCLICLYLYLPAKEMGKDQDCLLPVEEAGIIWDSICFFFLLLQRRIFLSYYFLHVMLDFQASALQASRWDWSPRELPWVSWCRCPPHSPVVPRGVALFKASTLKRMRHHQQAEKKSLAQLKRQ